MKPRFKLLSVVSLRQLVVNRICGANSKKNDLKIQNHYYLGIGYKWVVD